MSSYIHRCRVLVVGSSYLRYSGRSITQQSQHVIIGYSSCWTSGWSLTRQPGHVILEPVTSVASEHGLINLCHYTVPLSPVTAFFTETQLVFWQHVPRCTASLCYPVSILQHLNRYSANWFHFRRISEFCLSRLLVKVSCCLQCPHWWLDLTVTYTWFTSYNCFVETLMI